MTAWTRKDLTGLDELTAEEIIFLLDTARAFKGVGERSLKKVPALRGKTLVFLAPCAASTLVRTAYAWGARNVELHVAQSTAPVVGAKGIVFPTFMPETA